MTFLFSLSYSVLIKATLSALVVILSSLIGSSILKLTPSARIISTFPPNLVIDGSNIISIEWPLTNFTESSNIHSIRFYINTAQVGTWNKGRLCFKNINIQFYD